MKDSFRKFSNATADKMGSPWAFALGVVLVLLWAATGPLFHYSDTWQLIINTGTSIGTFLMVFLIQSTQNRDAKAMHLKLDELIRAASQARNTLVNLEGAPDEVIDELKSEFQKIREGEGTTSSAGAEQP
jgi:Predicted small integral membrane protein